MSALDVLAMATGVFVLLLVMLMPYYRKTMDAEAEIEAVRVAAAESLAEVQSLEATAARNRAEAGAAAAEAAELQARATALEQAARQRLRPTPVVQEGPDPKRQAIEALDLVFAIDTTASMTPVIHDLAVSMRSIVRILQRLVPSVRIGISAYKDHDIPAPSGDHLAADPDRSRICRGSWASSRAWRRRRSAAGASMRTCISASRRRR